MSNPFERFGQIEFLYQIHSGCMTKFFKRAKSSAKASASFSLSPQRGEGWGEGWKGSHSAADSHILFLEICREFGGHKNFVLHPSTQVAGSAEFAGSVLMRGNRLRTLRYKSMVTPHVPTAKRSQTSCN
jgi:hypothetical protein